MLRTPTAVLLLPLLCLSAPGCQSAMSSTSDTSADGTARIVRNEFPLRFKTHNFEAYCYNAIGCRIFYSHTWAVDDAPEEVSPPPKMINYKDFWGGGIVGIANFPPPAIVTWKSMDGVAHEAHVDIGEIFKDELIRHNVPAQDIPVETMATGNPNIILEVNDRSISVYMRAMIFLKDTPARKGDFREELIHVWSRTY
jgi:hypothetical protein